MNEPLSIDQDTPVKIDGRTKAGRAQREAIARDEEVAAAAAAVRARRSSTRNTYPHEPTHEPTRGANGRVIVQGRNGELLTRKRTDDGGDEFNIPEDLIPPGWEYQWCAISIIGNTEVLMEQNLRFAEQGWRPVPSDRPGLAGRFMPVGHKGNVVRGQCMLMERPKPLCDEAREEAIAKARQQVADRDESLMGRKANLRGSMQDGFTMGQRYRGTGANVKMSIDRGLDIPVPQHQLANPGE